MPYPVEYVYDEYGRRVEMRTFREGSFDWDGTEWPDGTDIAADVTSWAYEQATGLLLSKVDAAGEATSYTYGAAGRLATRTWAREDGSARHPITFYGYDEETGELVSVDYRLGALGAAYGSTVNDTGTPDVAYTYDRLGRQSSVSDGVGTRTIGYDPSTLQLASETMSGTGTSMITITFCLGSTPRAGRCWGGPRG